MRWPKSLSCIAYPFCDNISGLFPGEHGLVAPGMSCHYAIRFAPDSLRDFEDEIIIQTQSTIPIKVPILGRRPPPQLTCKYNKKNMFEWCNHSKFYQVEFFPTSSENVQYLAIELHSCDTYEPHHENTCLCPMRTTKAHISLCIHAV